MGTDTQFRVLRPRGTGQKPVEKPGKKISKNPLTDYLREMLGGTTAEDNIARQLLDQ